MKTSGNTILITGGGSGIGRGLAEAFHALGNEVIIAGRTEKTLAEVTKANPGMKSATVDMSDLESIRAFAQKLQSEFPKLNVIFNNAGAMKMENVLEKGEEHLQEAETMLATNVLGVMRLTALLLPQLRKQEQAAIVNTSSGLAFVPLAVAPTYCATKAAVHSYTESLRDQLSETSIEVLELIPPYVATNLGGEQQANDPRAMPLKEFIDEVMEIFKTQPDPKEICVKRVDPLRDAAEGGRANYEQFFRKLNDSFNDLSQGH